MYLQRLLYISTTMIYLQTDTSNQELLLPLYDSHYLLNDGSWIDYTHYLLIITNETSSQVLAQVPIVSSENERITTLLVDTTGLISSGRYRYDVYVQNSNTNTNPTDASVLGLTHKGWGELKNNAQYYNVPTITMPEDVIIPIT